MREQLLSDTVHAMRRFSRFYTSRIGVLHEGLLGSSLSLTEGRIIFELAQAGQSSAATLANDLGLDTGYLSRLLRTLDEGGLIARRPSEADRRQSLLSLTDAGRRAFENINARSQAEVTSMLQGLHDADHRRLKSALETVQAILSGNHASASQAPYVLRPPQPGDLGWVVHRQASLYTLEYGFDETFEGLVAEIVARFIQNFDARRERCWIAEREGIIVGSVFLVRTSNELAQLRLLYVEPETRGVGIGRRLVDDCIRFARLAGYRRITLWTNDILISARRIYQAAGFRLMTEEAHHSFGHDLVGQNWELDL